MAEELSDVQEKLKSIKENLVKLSYDKRTKERLTEKLKEANIINERYNELITDLSEQVKSKK